jgi:hypothetical protein
MHVEEVDRDIWRVDIDRHALGRGGQRQTEEG